METNSEVISLSINISVIVHCFLKPFLKTFPTKLKYIANTQRGSSKLLHA